MENKGKNVFLRIILWFRDYFRIIRLGIKSIGDDNLTMLSSGMVFSMLIALVPCITFIGAFLSAFGAFGPFLESLRDMFSFAVGEEAGEYLVTMIGDFSQNAMSLGIVGLVSYLITGIFLVNKVYNVMNSIFRTRPKGTLLRRFFTFLFFLIAFTVLLVFAFGFSLKLENFVYNVFGFDFENGNPRESAGKGVLSILSLFAFLFVLLKFVPSAKIRSGAAISGALLGTIVISLLTYLFSFFIKMMVNISVIYGSLSSLFFLLLYLYALWYIILVVAEITYIYQFRPNRNIHISHPITSENEISEALSVMLEVANNYNSGKGVTTLKDLSYKLNIPLSRLNIYTGDLAACGLIISTNHQRTSFVIGRPSDQIYVSEIIEAVFSPFSLDGDEGVSGKVSILFKESGLERFRRFTLEDLIKEGDN